MRLQGLAALLDPSLAATVLTKLAPDSQAQHQPLPITDGRCHSTTERSLWFVGWDTTLAYGLSWGFWGWEVGERIRQQVSCSSAAAVSVFACLGVVCSDRLACLC